MLYRLDKSGLVVNEARPEMVQKEYRPVVDRAVRSCTSRLSDNLRSLYVRGSVSVGRASPGVSDLDLVVILRKKISNSDRTFLSEEAHQLEKEFSFVTFVDITAVTLEQLLTSREYSNLSIYLKTQSFCERGEDILRLFPEVRPGSALALRMYGELKQELSRLREIIKNPESEHTYLGERKPVEFWCVWIMRVLLRSGLGAVMMDRPIYSQDLQTCHDIFCEAYPSFQDQMDLALHFAMSPISDRKELLVFLDGLVPQYLALWDNLIKLYGKNL